MALTEGRDYQQAGARAFAFSLARLMAAALLLDDAQWNFQNHGDGRGNRRSPALVRAQLAPLGDRGSAMARRKRSAAHEDLPLAERAATTAPRKA